MAQTNKDSQQGQVNKYQDAYASIGTWPATNHLPIIYDARYNISFAGFELWNKLDAWKLHKVFQALIEKGLVVDGRQGAPSTEVKRELLSEIHDAEYLTELETSKLLMIRLTELPPLFFVPNILVRRLILRPIQFQTAGTILALGVALDRGWAIHIGGGFIHACHNRGAGWCAYDDITLAIRFARKQTEIKRVMIIDFGAVQGNGYEVNKLHHGDDDLIIVDVYNEVIFQQDAAAHSAINVERRLPCGTSSENYMKAVISALDEAKAYNPDAIVYAAGTNVLEQDYLGQFHVTREHVMERDLRVFEFARQKHVPICMVLSSGYAKSNFEVVAESIASIVEKLQLC